MSATRHQAIGLGAMAARNGIGTGRQAYGPRAGFTDTERRGGDGDWRDKSACRGVDPELHFPIGNTGPALLQIEDASGHGHCAGHRSSAFACGFESDEGHDHSTPYGFSTGTSPTSAGSRQIFSPPPRWCASKADSELHVMWHPPQCETRVPVHHAPQEWVIGPVRTTGFGPSSRTACSVMGFSASFPLSGFR